MAGLDIEVKWHTGAHGDPVPDTFRIGGHEIGVREVIDTWPASGYGYIKLRGVDGGVYILRHEEGASSWSVTLYDSGELESTRLST